MADLGNRANVNAAIDLLLDDLQPDEAIQPSDHNGLLKDILDTLSNGLSTTLRTGNTTSGFNIEVTGGDSIDFDNSTFLGSLVSDTLTANRQYTLPDKTGTVAMLSDITGGDNISNADLTWTGDTTQDLDGNNLTFVDGVFNIQGAGTSTGTTLALYDNDTTPNKTWEWLDNGNLNVGVIDASATFNESLNLVSTNGDVDGEVNLYSSSGSSPRFFQKITSWIFSPPKMLSDAEQMCLEE